MSTNNNNRQNRHNRSNHTNNIKNKAIQRVRWITYSFLFLSFIIISCIFIVEYFLKPSKRDFGELISDKKFEELYMRERAHKKNVTTILIEINEFNKLLLYYKQEMDYLRFDDPFVDLVKMHIQPVLDKVASIRTSTQIYETMDRSSGGPINFIETSLKELASLEENKLQLFQDEAAAVLREKFELMESLLDEANEHAKGDTMILEEDHEELLAYGINFYPEYEIDPDEVDPADLNMFSFELLVKVFDIAISILKRLDAEIDMILDMSHNKLREVFKQHDVLYEDDTVNSTNLEFLMENHPEDLAEVEKYFYFIEHERDRAIKEIEDMGLPEYFLYYLPYQRKVIFNLLLDNLFSGEGSTHYQTFKKLVSDISEDIAKVKERLNNLRYPSPPLVMREDL